METPPLPLLLLVLLSSVYTAPHLATAAVSVNVVSLGAKPDGRTDASKAFLAAWASVCGSTAPATLYVPAGRFLLGSVVFRGPCRSSATKVVIDGTLVAPGNYNSLGSSGGNWIGFDYVVGVSIFGGTLDGQGAGLWACKKARRTCPLGAKSLSIGHSKNVIVNGLTSINSQFFHMFIYGSEGVAVRGCNMTAPGDSPNTDGIHVQQSRGVTITTTTMATGDDCVSIGPDSSNIWIENVFCGPGHGISIGSLGNELNEPGVQNVTVKTAMFTGTQNGLRIKTWARPSTGFVKGAVFQNVIMKNVQNPILIDQNYCPYNRCPTQYSGVKIDGVVYRGITGTSATPVAVRFDCSPRYPCKGIVLQGIKLTYGSSPAQANCKYVSGSASGVITPPSCL